MDCWSASSCAGFQSRGGGIYRLERRLVFVLITTFLDVDSEGRSTDVLSSDTNSHELIEHVDTFKIGLTFL